MHNKRGGYRKKLSSKERKHHHKRDHRRGRHRRHYHIVKHRKKRVIQLTVFLLISIVSIFVGVEDLSVVDLTALTPDKIQLLLISRLPRLLSIWIAGASLSISGLIMQTITQNSFVSSSTSGTTEWAKLGIIFVMLFLPGANTLVKIGVSFIFALLGSLLFMFLLSKLQASNIVIVPLLGIMLGNVVSSVSTFVAYQFDLVQNMTSWLQGSFSLIIKGSYEFLYLSIPLVVVTYIYANYFTIAGMGDKIALNLGVNQQRIVRLGLVLVSMISALTITTVGSIPFVGLVVPNLVRIRHGNSVKNTLFDTAYWGALFVLLSDLIGRIIIYPHEVAIGVVISIVGSGVFLAILFRRNKNGSKA